MMKNMVLLRIVRITFASSSSPVSGEMDWKKCTYQMLIKQIEPTTMRLLRKPNCFIPHWEKNNEYVRGFNRSIVTKMGCFTNQVIIISVIAIFNWNIRYWEILYKLYVLNIGLVIN